MAFEAITTQEQLDAVLKERLERERQKYEGYEDYVKKANDYDGLKKKADEFEKTIADMRKSIEENSKKYSGYEETIKELNGKVKGYETNSVKLRIAHENGIPFELAEKLSGEDEDTIRKDAEAMSRFIKSGKTAPLASTEPTTVDEKKAAIKNTLAGLKGE